MTSKLAPEDSNLNQGFSYVGLDSEVRSFVEQRTYAIKSLMRRTAEDIIDIGLKLIEIKEILGHGKFNEWLKAEIDCGEWTARKFMEVSRKFKSVNFTDLEIAPSALYLLASKKTPDSAVDEILNRARQKERITHSTAKAILARHADINNSQAKSNITSTNLKTSNTKGLQSSFSFIDGESSPGKNTPPALSDNGLNSSSRLPRISSHSKKQSFDLISEIGSDTEQAPKSPFIVGGSICVTSLGKESLKWGGKVAKVEEQNGKAIRLVIEIDKILNRKNDIDA